MGAVIGANCVVTKDIPDYAVVVGCPGKIIKYRFNKNKVKIINDSEWWNYDLEKAKMIQDKIKKNHF